jgi:magnesium transporter
VDGAAATVIPERMSQGGDQLRILATRREALLTDVRPSELPALLADPEVNVWVDSWGSENEPAVQLARDLFKFHPIVINDCFEAREHPKLEVFDDHLFLITHGLTADSTVDHVEIVELDVFLGQRFLFTYHERDSRSVARGLELVLRNHGGPLRRGPAPLLHAILDRQVESLTPVLDGLETRIEGIEDRVILHPTNRDLTTTLALKRTTLQLRRWLSKQREVVLRLSRNEFSLVAPGDAILFRDVYDHLQRFTDVLENEREMIVGVQETYMSVINLRLGEIMKFLTIFTAVLMPLTVITGIYGMNFEHMPELKARWGYPMVLSTMVVTALVVLFLFRRRGWIGGGSSGGGGERPPPPPRSR